MTDVGERLGLFEGHLGFVLVQASCWVLLGAAALRADIASERRSWLWNAAMF